MERDREGGSGCVWCEEAWTWRCGEDRQVSEHLIKQLRDAQLPDRLIVRGRGNGSRIIGPTSKAPLKDHLKAYVLHHIIYFCKSLVGLVYKGFRALLLYYTEIQYL